MVHAQMWLLNFSEESSQIAETIHKVSSPLAYAGYAYQFFHVPMATTGAEKLDDGLESRSRKCLGIQANFPTKNFRAFDLERCSDWPAVGVVAERSVEAIRVCLDDSASPL